MNRLTRLTSILIQLQSKRVTTANELAQRFDVSLRTIYRDIATLQEAGVPIGSEIGVGYFIVEGYTLPPVSLTEEEANALIISQKFVQLQGDQSLSKHYHSFLVKIKSVLRSFQKHQLEILEARTSTFTKGDILQSNSLSELQKCITRKLRVNIVYQSGY